MNAKRTILIGISLLALGAGTAAAGGQWIHLRVDDGRDGAHVRINLPLALVERVAEMVPAEARGRSRGRVRIDDVDFTPAELRALWRSLDEGDNVRIIELEDPDESVHAWRHGGYLHLRVRDASDLRPWDREDVHVKMPAAVVEALLAGDEDELDVAAAIQALARHGEGELVTVTGDDETVRIWIDGSPEGRR